MLLGLFTNVNDILSGQHLFLQDFIFGPIFIAISYSIVKNIADKYYKGTVNHTYLMYAYYVKIASTILFTLIFAFYYKGGDTFAYQINVLQLRDLLPNDLAATYNIMFRPKSFEAQYVIRDYMLSGGTYMTDNSTRLVIVFGFFVSFLCFNSFLFLSLVCSMLALIGCWKLYRAFSELYPHLHKEMAISCLFIPSVCFWSSGFLKDPICLGALGLFTYASYDLFIKRRAVVANILIIIFMVYVIMNIKVYIILAYFPAVVFWIFSRYRYTIKSNFIRVVIGPLLVVIGVGLAVFVLLQIGQAAKRYSFESMMRTAQDTQNWLVYSSKMQGGSFYTLGNIDYSVAGMIKIFPKAVNVSLFRPYIWEARKPILIIASIEGMVTFFFTIRLLFKAGLFNFFKLIIANPEVQFCLIFSIIFAFAVGFTSFNFGALARYKIPFMPFYYIALFILADAQKKSVAVEVRK